MMINPQCVACLKQMSSHFLISYTVAGDQEMLALKLVCVCESQSYQSYYPPGQNLLFLHAMNLQLMSLYLVLNQGYRICQSALSFFHSASISNTRVYSNQISHPGNKISKPQDINEIYFILVIAVDLRRFSQKVFCSCDLKWWGTIIKAINKRYILCTVTSFQELTMYILNLAKMGEGLFK